jgi:hypothetical protein
MTSEQIDAILALVKAGGIYAAVVILLIVVVVLGKLFLDQVKRADGLQDLRVKDSQDTSALILKEIKDLTGALTKLTAKLDTFRPPRASGKDAESGS